MSKVGQLLGDLGGVLCSRLVDAVERALGEFLAGLAIRGWGVEQNAGPRNAGWAIGRPIPAKNPIPVKTPALNSLAGKASRPNPNHT